MTQMKRIGHLQQPPNLIQQIPPSPKSSGAAKYHGSLLRFRNTSRGPLRLPALKRLPLPPPSTGSYHVPCIPVSYGRPLSVPEHTGQRAQRSANSGSGQRRNRPSQGPDRSSNGSSHRSPGAPSQCDVSAFVTKFRHLFFLLRFDETCGSGAFTPAIRVCAP